MPAPPRRQSRRGYLDWMRGLAVLIMIEAHIVDSWTAAPYRTSGEFAWAILLGGYGAPLFLYLAGLSVVLAASSRLRRTGSIRAARNAVARRGAEIFVLAFLFRLQAVILSWGPWRTLLKVDILNIMGPSIAAAASLWGAGKTARTRYVLFASAALAIVLVTPIVRSFAPLAALPDPLEGYLRPVPGLTNFVFFPWAAFVFSGAVAGLLIDGTATRPAESRVNVALAIAGVTLIVVGYAGSYLPSIYVRSEFWTTSPSYFAIKVGLLTTAVAGAYLWGLRPWRRRWSPMEQLGRSSLFIYWIHVEMVYGLMSLPLHAAMTLWQVAAALVVFVGLMLAVSVLKDALVGRWKGIRPRTGASASSDPPGIPASP